MKGLRKHGFQPIVGIMQPKEDIHALYNDNGFETVDMPWIPKLITWVGSEGKRYNPVTWLNIFDAWRKWKKAHRYLEAFLDKKKIDIVHLNSVCLSNPATLLMKKKFPFIWHVRENGPNHKGRRFRYIKKNLLKAERVIFLSNAEQRAWIGDHSHGTVVHNFIDFKQFDSEKNQKQSKKNLDIKDNQKVILYVGGIKLHKGIFTLLESLKKLKDQNQEFVCLMPDTFISDKGNPSRIEKQVLKYIEDYNLEGHCRLLPFNPNIIELYAACDVLVFPATQPHFARPVIEAGGMKKPVIASNLPSIDELVVNNETGFLIERNNSDLLAKKIKHLFDHPTLANEMGEKGHAFVFQNFEQEKQMQKILKVYNSLASKNEPL